MVLPTVSDEPEDEVGVGDFFWVDTRVFRQACSLGMNAAVAYLLIARGAGGKDERRTSQWSVAALSKRTGISERRIKEAIGSLVSNGLLELARTGKHPIYRLLLASETPEQKGLPQSGSERAWMPNTLVDPALDGSPSALEEVRRTGQVETLRLLVELYRWQDLEAYGGVDPRVVRARFDLGTDREPRAIEHEGCVVVTIPCCVNADGVRFVTITAGEMAATLLPPGGARDAFVGRVEDLLRLGLLTLVPHVMENDSAEAEMLHPYGCAGAEGEAVEQELGIDGDVAARAMLASLGRDAGIDDLHVPVEPHFRRATIIGVVRLALLPETSVTATWRASLSETADARRETYYRWRKLAA